MPIFQVSTNLPRSKIPDDLGLLLATALSKTLRGKTLQDFCVHIATDQISFAGSQADEPTGPTVVGILRSIGSVDLEDNRRTSEVITDLLAEQLADVPRKEIRIAYENFAPEMIGVNGQIVTDIWATKDD